MVVTSALKSSVILYDFLPEQVYVNMPIPAPIVVINVYPEKGHGKPEAAVAGGVLTVHA